MAGHDGKIFKVARGGANRGKVKNVSWKWSHLGQLLAEPHVLPVSMKELLKLTPNQQNDHKTANGYFIAAHCDDGRRARANIHFRSLLSFDCDTVQASFPDLLDHNLTALHKWEYRWHTTAKSISNRPRVRIYLLPKTEIPADKYAAVSRILAEKLDPEMTTVDPVSFRVAQMMYLPVVTKGGEYRHGRNSGELLDWQAELEAFGTADDISTWPRHPDEAQLREAQAKAQDPTTKPGIVGDFCRVYDIFSAIDTFLPDVYTMSDAPSTKPRYTFNAGHSANGAEVQDEGLFLYSHHGTDPTADQLVNAFDLVRIHKFGELDQGIDPETQVTKLPSYAKMVAFAQADPEVQALRIAVTEDFSDEDIDGYADEPELIEQAAPPAPKDAPAAPSFDADIEALLGAPSKRGNKPPVTEKLSKPKDVVEELNRKHAIVKVGGSTVILNIPNPRDVHAPITYSKVSDFALWYRSRKVPFGPQGKEIPLSDHWLDHPLSQRYERVEFAPGAPQNPKVYNLWRGFSVRPDPEASCQLLLDHILDNICCGDEALYAYAMGWLADMIQNPAKKPGVAMVLRGLKGIGKDTVADIVGRLFPHNHIKVASMGELTSPFNGEQERALLIHLEEALWGGQKDSHGKLQNLITSPRMRFERKGIDSVQSPSYCRLFMSSNEDWVAPVTKDERRYFVLNVSDRRRGDTGYFKAIYQQIEHEGGLGALLHVLQTWDLSRFNIRSVPQTEALGEQKLQGLKGVEAWWHETLADGILTDARGPKHQWAIEPVRVMNTQLYSLFLDWMKDRRSFGHGAPPPMNEFGRRITKLCPGIVRDRKVPGETGGASDYPALPLARAAFNTVIGHDLTWDEPADIGEGEFDDEDTEALI